VEGPDKSALLGPRNQLRRGCSGGRRKYIGKKGKVDVRGGETSDFWRDLGADPCLLTRKVRSKCREKGSKQRVARAEKKIVLFGKKMPQRLLYKKDQRDRERPLPASKGGPWRKGFKSERRGLHSKKFP